MTNDEQRLAEIRALVEEYRHETPGEYQRAVARSIEDRAEHDVPWLVDRIAALEALLAAARTEDRRDVDVSGTANERRGSLTVLFTPDVGASEADDALAALDAGRTSWITRTNPPPSFLAQLRLRVAKDPTWAERITVYYTDEQGQQHRVGLRDGDVCGWPVGFENECLRIEQEITDVLRASRLTAARPSEETR